MKDGQMLDVKTIDLVHDGSFMLTAVPKKKHKLPGYSCFGAKYIGTIIGDLGKPARELLAHLVQNRDLETNEAQYIVIGVNDKCKLTRAYNELKEKNLVKRIRQQWYLINPAAVFPLFDQYQNILNKWNAA